MARGHGYEVWEQNFLKLIYGKPVDGVFANAALFHVPSQEVAAGAGKNCTNSLKPPRSVQLEPARP